MLCIFFSTITFILILSLGTPSPTKYPCPPGTYTTSSSLYHASQCTICEQSHYCLGGESFTRLCPPGHYCPNNTKFAEEFPCANRTYNPDNGKYEQAQCKDCPMGYFCEKGTVQPYECPIGTYMPYGYNATSTQTEGEPGGYQNDCLDCPAGHFCLNATVVPRECGVGFYTKSGQSVCQVRLKIVT